LYGLKLLWIADQHQLGALLFYMRDDALHLSGADHASLIDNKDIACLQLIFAVLPSVLQRMKGPTGYAG